VIEAGRLWNPGPTEVRPDVLNAMSRPMIFHRSAEMEALMRRVTPRLGAVFGTARPVHVVTGSGTAAMELAIRGGTVARVLSIVHGDFGERFARMAEGCGRTVTRLRSEPGDVVPREKIAEALRAARYDAVTLTHSETAVGVLSDVAAVARIVREHDDCLLLVDAVSSAGATPIQMDAWGIDAAVSASQKALALPPGLGFAAVSDRFVARARGLTDRGTYLDILRYEEFAAKSQSPTTPAVSLLYALDTQLESIELETLAARYARHARMAEVCAAWVDRAEAGMLGISVLARAGHRSPSVTAIRHVKPSAVIATMREQGFALGGGQAELKGSTFRIGHMGDHTVQGLEAMLDVLEGVLRAK
jgi:aspartate aminotransferase-like enzyme